MSKKLKIIDFSQGIKSTEVQHNFDALQNQLNKERISVAGSGIAYGLNFSIEDFVLKIEEGCLINKKGEEVYIDETNITIQKPILIEKIERGLIANEYNRVYLTEIPYALNRLTVSQNVPISESGISATLSGTEDNIPLASNEERVLNLKPVMGTLEGASIDVKYYYTFKRRDVIYIDNDYKIQYREGITSPSPSVPSLKKDEYTYILGYIEVNGHDLDILTNEVKAGVKIIKDFKSIRNVYTDDNNKLYLCGTPFESLKVIHLVEPSNPEENTFWYDATTNKLKIWKATDEYTFAKEYTVTTSNPNAEHKFTTDVSYLYKGKQLSVYLNGKKLNSNEYIEGSDLTTTQKRESYIFSSEFQVLVDLTTGDKISYRIERTDGFMEWVSINDSSYINLEERLLWNPDEMKYEEAVCEHDKQHFFFHATKNKSCLFTPDKNCLEVLIDQIPLHNDQFKEITMIDAIASEDADMIKRKLISYYGYNDEFSMENIHEEYENIGIGFKLNAPLDKDSYVEVRVKQRVNSNPISKRFQRTATFVAEGSEEYIQYIKEDNGNVIYNPPIFKTQAQYRYDENQLDVFLNGRRLEKDIEWIEVKSNQRSLKAVPCDSFELLPSSGIANGDRVSYKLTTTVYSYDHVQMLLSDFDKKIEDCEYIIEKTREDIYATKENVENQIEIVENQIETVKQITNNLDETYIRKNEVLNMSNLPVSILSGIFAGSFYETITVDSERRINITDICSDKDFSILFNFNDNNGNRVLRRGTDENAEYDIIKQGDETFLVLYSTSIEAGHMLYLTGVKFGI